MTRQGRKSLNLYFSFCLFLITVPLIVASLMGFSQSGKVKDNILQMQCDSAVALENLIAGYSNQTTKTNWIGYDTALKRVTLLKNQIKALPNDISTAFELSEWLDDGSGNLDVLIDGMNTVFADTKIKYPDLNNEALVTPIMVTDLGPKNVAGKITYNLDNEKSTTINLVLANLLDIKSQTTQIQDNTHDILSGVSMSFSLIQALYKSTNYTKTGFQSQIDNINKISQYVYVFTLIEFIQIIVCCLFTFLAISCIICDCVICRKGLMGTSTVSLCCASMFSLIFAMIFLPLGLVTSNACEIFDEIYQDQTATKLTEYQFTIPDELKTCIWGDGNFIKQVNIAEAISSITNLTQPFDLLQEQSQILEQNSESEWIKSYIVEVNTYKTFQTPFAENSPALSQDEVLLELNSWSDYNTPDSLQESPMQGNCQVTQDHIVFDQSNCLEDETIITEATELTSIGSKACVVLDTLSTPTNRYSVSAYSGCQIAVNSQIVSRYNSLSTYKKDANLILDDLNTHFTSYQQEYKDTLDLINNIYTKVETLKTNLEPLLNEIENENTGIVNTLNCNFIKDNIVFIYKDLCLDMFPNLAKLSSIFFVFGILTCSSSCLTMIIGRRLRGKKRKENQRLNPSRRNQRRNRNRNQQKNRQRKQQRNKRGNKQKKQDQHQFQVFEPEALKVVQMQTLFIPPTQQKQQRQLNDIDQAKQKRHQMGRYLNQKIKESGYNLNAGLMNQGQHKPQMGKYLDEEIKKSGAFYFNK